MTPIHTPITQAADWYRSCNPEFSFERLIEWYMNHGTVYSDDQTFVLARPWDINLDVDSLFAPIDRPNTWLIFLAAINGVSPLGRFMDLAPFPLPYVAFHRRGVLRAYTWEALDCKLRGNHGNPSRRTST